MIVYKIKHLITGYYYQPIACRNRERYLSNLSAVGKLYSIKPKLAHLKSKANIRYTTFANGIPKTQYLKFKPEEWTIVEYELKERHSIT
jgi:hypothetical protein